LRRLTTDPVLAERVAFDYRRADLEPRTRAMLDYAVKITRQSVECTEDDIAALRAHGYSDEQIAEVVGLVSLQLLTGAFNLVAGIEPGPEDAAELTSRRAT